MTIAGYIIIIIQKLILMLSLLVLNKTELLTLMNDWIMLYLIFFLRDLLVLYLDCMSPGNLSGFSYHCLEVSICLGVLSGKDSGNF